MLLIFVGILLIFLGAILGQKENVKTEWGVFGLIGPIPFGAWNSEKILILTVMFFIIFVVLLLLMKTW